MRLLALTGPVDGRAESAICVHCPGRSVPTPVTDSGDDRADLGPRQQCPLGQYRGTIPDGGRLQYHYLKDSNKHWKIGDLRDNAALAVTVPYCDIVVTDSAAWNTAVNRAHLDKEFGTAIFRSLTDLAAHLN